MGIWEREQERQVPCRVDLERPVRLRRGQVIRRVILLLRRVGTRDSIDLSSSCFVVSIFLDFQTRTRLSFLFVIFTSISLLLSHTSLLSHFLGYLSTPLHYSSLLCLRTSYFLTFSYN